MGNWFMWLWLASVVLNYWVIHLYTRVKRRPRPNTELAGVLNALAGQAEYLRTALQHLDDLWCSCERQYLITILHGYYDGIPAEPKEHHYQLYAFRVQYASHVAMLKSVMPAYQDEVSGLGYPSYVPSYLNAVPGLKLALDRHAAMLRSAAMELIAEETK